MQTRLYSKRGHKTLIVSLFKKNPPNEDGDGK